LSAGGGFVTIWAMRNAVVIIAVILVLGGILGGVIWKFQSIARDKATIDQEIIQPWIDLVIEGQAGEAREQFASDVYQAKVSQEALESAWKKQMDEKGALQRAELKLAKEISEPGRGTYLRVRYLLHYADGTEAVAWDVVDTDAGWRIDRSYHVRATSELTPTPR